MLEFLTASDNLPYLGALLFMVVIGLIELFGLGSGLISGGDISADVDFDGDVGATGSILQWINVGRLPVLVLLVAFLTSFGLVGLIAQRFIVGITGDLVPALIGVPVTLVLAIPFTRFFGAGLAKVMPKDETSAVGLDSLIGRMATIVLGNAAKDSPAQAKVRDSFGQTHYVMVAPDRDRVTLKQDETVLLVRRAGTIFYAIRSDSEALSSG